MAGKSIYRWYDHPWAALIFFTRLPLWRIYQPPKASYSAVVEWWPLTGWVTGGVMGAALFLSSLLFPYYIAIILAILARLMLTGCLHEDGLADFSDAFGGGGRDRARILSIMKDSRVGTYGVVTLIAYFALLFSALLSLPPVTASLLIVSADPFSKMISSEIIMMMPYARSAETSKAGVVYRRVSLRGGIGLALQGLLPMAVTAFFFPPGEPAGDLYMLIVIPCLVMYFLYLLIWRRLHGYTGDCCGAVFLLVELSFYLTAACKTVCLT